MRATIYLPERLAQVVKTYLQEHPDKTLSTLVQEALEAHLQRDPTALFKLAGIVKKARTTARENESMQSPLCSKQ